MSAFKEWLANDDGVRAGMKIRDEWADAARAGWNAALEGAAKAAEETAQRIVHIAADDGLGAVKVVCTTCAKNIRAMIEKP